MLRVNHLHFYNTTMHLETAWHFFSNREIIYSRNMALDFSRDLTENKVIDDRTSCFPILSAIILVV